MSNVLVTGASGFIGRALCQRLKADGHRVVMVSREQREEDDIAVVPDFLLYEKWQDILREIDVVVHLAGRAHVMKDLSEDPLAVFKAANTAATVKLAQQAAIAGVKRFVFMSSIGVNGNETDEKPFSVMDAPQPHSPYAVSKYEAELGLKKVANEQGLEFVIIRPPLVYGPNAPGNFGTMTRLVAKRLPLPLGAATVNRRSFVGLDNLVDLTVRCMDHHQAAGETFLVSDGEDLSTADLLRRLSFAFGKQPRLLSVPLGAIHLLTTLLGKKDIAQRLLANLQVDIQHTRNTLDWRPPFSVEQGLAKVASSELSST